jgi:hypothetical protein
MSLYVDLHQENAFRIVLNYFERRHLKVVASIPPSYVKAELGSWWDFGEISKPKGEVEANICEKDNGCVVNFAFDFTSDYLKTFMEVMFTIALIWIVFLAFSALSSLSKAFSPPDGTVQVVLMAVGLIGVEVAAGVLRRYLAGKSLIKGFDRFLKKSAYK